jgi:hypothetical protein
VATFQEEHGADEDYHHDHEAAAARADRVDATLPLIPEFPVGA